MDVEGTKDVKQLITLLAITGQFIPRSRRGSRTRIQDADPSVQEADVNK